MHNAAVEFCLYVDIMCKNWLDEPGESSTCQKDLQAFIKILPYILRYASMYVAIYTIIVTLRTQLQSQLLICIALVGGQSLFTLFFLSKNPNNAVHISNCCLNVYVELLILL